MFFKPSLAATSLLFYKASGAMVRLWQYLWPINVQGGDQLYSTTAYFLESLEIATYWFLVQSESFDNCNPMARIPENITMQWQGCNIINGAAPVCGRQILMIPNRASPHGDAPFVLVARKDQYVWSSRCGILMWSVASREPTTESSISSIWIMPWGDRFEVLAVQC